MGRNAGTQIFWSTLRNGSDNFTIWYCQQHGKWDQKNNIDYQTSQDTLQLEATLTHGCSNP